VGIYAAEDHDENGKNKVNPLFIQRHEINPGKTYHTTQVKGKPVKTGIDPYNKLIDRIPDVNTKNIDMK
tara:strand:- start:23 stop:229 length:207 start_codon:yes stop_codon:yes gene_type:complete